MQKDANLQYVECLLRSLFNFLNEYFHEIIAENEI